MFAPKPREIPALRKALPIIFLFLFLSAAGCGNKNDPGPGNPVTLSLWHNFGGQMQTTMDQLVEEFNLTLGKEKGIHLNVTSISDSATIKEKLAMIAADDPGAPEMPDIATCYPQTAALLAGKDIITPLDAYFTKAELEAYLPQFLAEGRLAEELFVFPFAKSTEVLFLNLTLFNQFSEATGVPIQQLSTFEGIAAAALEYYQWTDAQTPGIIGNGKQFYTADSFFNLAQVGMRQLGNELFKGENLQLDSADYRHIWSLFFEPAVKGGFAIYPGYSSDLAKTGDIVCSTGSTAGILFYGTDITFPDNTTLEVEYAVLPYPIFAGGSKIAIQRGGGLVVAKTTPLREKAAAIFLKWFTAPEQNMKFVASTGYLPVTHAAFEHSLFTEIAKNDNVNIRKLLATAVTVHQEYDFYTPPVFEKFDALSKSYEIAFKQAATTAREEYLQFLTGLPPAQAYKEASKGVFESFCRER